MPQDLWTAVDSYIADLFVGIDPALEAALQASADAGLPAIAVSPNEGKLLMLLARAIAARRILEIGTLGGYSSIWLARALPEGGRLVTLEMEEAHARVARANIARAGLSDRVDIRVGRALDTLPALAQERPFDLIFIDADKPNNPGYFEWAMKLARRGSLIIADNVVRDGEVIDAESHDEGVAGIRRFNQLVAGDRRVSATAIQTVGAKGYDGFALILVLDDA
jgi:predicted O-methyltransferase YrrM